MLIVVPGFAFSYNNFKKGNELYLNGDYSGALGEYTKFSEKKKNKYEGFYNAGNAYFQGEDYQKALDMYNQALTLNPKDEDTKYNMELAKEKLKTQKTKPQENKQDNKQEQSKKQEGKDGQGKNEKSQNDKNKAQGKEKEKQNQQGQQGQQGTQSENTAQQRPNPGMSEDEMQAMLNNMKKGEQQYKKYFGKQQMSKQKTDAFGMPDLFNMSPEEVRQYMLNRMNGNFQQPKKQGSTEKDW